MIAISAPQDHANAPSRGQWIARNGARRSMSSSGSAPASQEFERSCSSLRAPEISSADGIDRIEMPVNGSVPFAPR